VLTRFKVSGFKNLVGVDISFGPFTCIAGVNGVGKSNLFDAILFLSALSEKTFMDAAKSVRDDEGKTTDVKSLFHRVGDFSENKITLEAEMIVPGKGTDDLGVEAEASITFLKYVLELEYRNGAAHGSQGGIELIKEELTHINIGDAPKHILFPHSKNWLKSAVKGRRQKPLISTIKKEMERKETNIRIRLHQDRGESRGIPKVFLARNLPRTVLSTANATENKTALVAKREMQSWRLLLLEPSALRRPDKFDAPDRLGHDGSHLPATLYRLTKSNASDSVAQDKTEKQVYYSIANRLSELIDEVYEIRVDRDEKRELLTLEVKDRGGTFFSARDLSDGTLRFLAAAVIELDPEAQGLLCLEEPENGIHPSRIPLMIQLLQDIACDVNESVASDNPLRQVIVNTHSPAVVAQVPDDSLLVAEHREIVREGHRFKAVSFSCLIDTWRKRRQEDVTVVSRGKLLAYLNPVSFSEERYEAAQPIQKTTETKRRVIDREDLHPLLPGFTKSD
jgi:predicted ATPase